MKKIIKDKGLRVKLHFAETAKQMILNDGVESVSVRKVAKEAGYAYATIYNHFKNLDELLWLTRSLFIQDISDYFGTQEESKNINDIFTTYAQYYIEHPTVFSFLYFHKLDLSYKTSTSLIEEPDFKKHMAVQMLDIAEQASISPEKLQGIMSTFMYAVHGLLTLSFAENDEIKVEDLPERITEVARVLGV